MLESVHLEDQDRDGWY